MEKYELAEKDYKEGMKYKEIAEKYDVSINTVKSWKTRKWGKKKSVHTKKKSVHTKKDATINEDLEVSSELSSLENSDLNDKQKMFCIYYVKLFNASKAYQKAYDCLPRTADSNGYRMLRNDRVKKEIMRLKQYRMAEELFDKQDVLQKYKDIAFADITDFATFGTEKVNTIDDKGNEVDYEVNRMYFKDSSEVDGTILTEVKQGKDGVSIKLADKMKALDFLARYTDLLNENELKQLKIEKERIAIRKENGEQLDDRESDGFIEALKGANVKWE